MVLHLPHTEGGFGVTLNCVTKDVTVYTTTSRFVSLIDNPFSRVLVIIQLLIRQPSYQPTIDNETQIINS